MPESRAEWSPRDRDAAAAVVSHHRHLADELDRRADALLGLAEVRNGDGAEQTHRDLLEYVHTELLPHARAEEETLYRAAATQPEGKLLIEGMLGEHRAIMGLVDELEKAKTPVRAAAAGRALTALFAAHLAKENDLVVPLVGSAEGISLADLLEGMHALLGAGDQSGAHT